MEEIRSITTSYLWNLMEKWDNLPVNCLAGFLPQMPLFIHPPTCRRKWVPWVVLQSLPSLPELPPGNQVSHGKAGKMNHALLILIVNVKGIQNIHPVQLTWKCRLKSFRLTWMLVLIGFPGETGISYKKLLWNYPHTWRIIPKNIRQIISGQME